MGQSISSAVEAIQNNAEKEKLANDAMNSLIELAKMQVEAFELAIRGQNDTQLIPIDKILEKDNIIQCNISQNPADIGNMIEDTFSSFISGDVLGGVSKLVSNGLKLLLGSYSGNSASRDTYAITCGRLGGISRIDMHFYSYRYTSSQLTDVAKQVLCVSIVRSSVDPTRLSDATLRNIVQNTYSASSVEDLEKMYQQLRIARDADLQSRSGNAGALVAQSMLSSTARANQFSHPSFKATRLTNGLRTAAEVKYTTFEHFYEARLQINTAAANVDSLKNWIYGYLYADFEKETIDNGLVVVAKVDPASMSNSVIQGHVSVVLSSEVRDGRKQVHQQLMDALEGAKSNKCPIPVVSSTIDGARHGDDDGVSDHNGDGPEWPKYDEDGTELWPEDHFSDIGDSDELSESWKEKLNGNSKSDGTSIKDVKPDRTYSYQNIVAAKQVAKDYGMQWQQTLMSDSTMQKFHIFLMTTGTNSFMVPENIESFFGDGGSHIHICLMGDLASGWHVQSVCLTLRHPNDHVDAAIDEIDEDTGKYQFHWHPRKSSRYGPLGFKGIMDNGEDRFDATAKWWVGLIPHGLGDRWNDIVSERKAWRDLWHTSYDLGTRADHVMDVLTGGSPDGLKTGDWLKPENSDVLDID